MWCVDFISNAQLKMGALCCCPRRRRPPPAQEVAGSDHRAVWDEPDPEDWDDWGDPAEWRTFVPPWDHLRPRCMRTRE